MNPLVLVFDVGTQSARGLLVTKHGTFVDKEQIIYEEAYFSRFPGWAEQKPDFYFNKIADISQVLLARNQDKLDCISAVTLTTIRDSVLCLDKDNTPLRDIILWLDNRKANYDGCLPLNKRLLFSLVGMGDSVKKIYKATATNWIRQNQPAIWQSAEKFVMLPTYLN